MPKKLRSQIFHKFARLDDKFKEHFGLIWGFSPDQRKALLEGMPVLIQALTQRETGVARQNLTKAIGGSESNAVKAIDALMGISNEWRPREDEVDSVLNDFAELDLLPSKGSEREIATEFLRSFLDILNDDNQRRLAEEASRMFLPSLKGIGIGIDFRVVVESQYDWRGDDPATYEPVIRTTVPIAIVRIVLDEGDPIIFQCSREETEMMIRQLQATLKEMDASKGLVR